MGYNPTWFLLACVPIYKQSLPNPIWPNLDFMAPCPYSTQCPSKAYLVYLGCQMVQISLHAKNTWTSWPCTESYIDCVPNLPRDFLIWKPGGQFFREPIPSWPWGMMWDVGKIKIHFVFFCPSKKTQIKKINIFRRTHRLAHRGDKFVFMFKYDQMLFQKNLLKILLERLVFYKLLVNFFPQAIWAKSQNKVSGTILSPVLLKGHMGQFAFHVFLCAIFSNPSHGLSGPFGFFAHPQWAPKKMPKKKIGPTWFL